jgi:hypothetical protein
MKKIIFSFFFLAAVLAACNNNGETKTAATATAASSIKLPYEAAYTTDFNNNVSDSDLLTVLNTYKYWENGDMKGLRATMGDSMEVAGATGFTFKGGTDSLMKVWQLSRDSLSSVKITMFVWLKNHANKDGADYINTWYREIDTYKTGKVDSANYSDYNQVKKGKVILYSSFKQKLKP